MTGNPSGPDSLQELRAKFEASLAANPDSRVEQFSTSGDTETIRELLKSEMTFRLQQGESLTDDEFSGRFPSLAGEISELLSDANSPTRVDDEEPPPERPLKYKVLGDYELWEMLGRGGMGVVYRARQKKLNRMVAVKTIASGQLADEEEVRRFRQEAEAAARLDHPGIVPVFEIGEAEGVIFFSMGYVDGESLSRRLHHANMTPRDAARILLELSTAVHYAHEAGVIHRDLKPGNILIDKSDRPRITDFGLAKFVDQEGMTMTGAVVGTPSYMSPEQAAGSPHIDRRTDVYGLGAILFACLCGQAPFRGTSAMDTLKKVINDRPVSPRQVRPELPRDLATICEKCLEKDPADRYSTAGELADELTRFLEGRPVLARPVPVWTRAGQWCRRKPLLAGMTAAIALLLIGGTAVSTYFAILAGNRADTAEKGFAAAREQSELSLKTLQTVIYTVQDQLKDLPAAREVRKELLQQVLEDLKLVSNGYVAQAEVNRDTARVLTDLAKLYLVVGGEAGTDISGLAEQHYHQAVEMYEELVDESPGDEKLLQEAFQTALRFGNDAREFRHFETAIRAHTTARQFASYLIEQFPNNPDSEMAYMLSSEAVGEALLRSGQLEKSRPYILEAVALAEARAREAPTTDSYDKLALCYCTVGDLHRKAGDFDEAAVAYEKMCDMTTKLMELEPDNAELICDRSTDFERLGDLEMSRENFARAVEYFELSREWTEKYMADDPGNLFRVQQSTWAYSKLAQACEATGDNERAAWALAELEKIKSRLNQQESPEAAGN